MVEKDLRLHLEAAMDSQQIKEILQQLKWALQGQLPEKDFLRFQQIAMYQENTFSPVATEQSIQAAKVRVLQYLADKPVLKQAFSKDVAVLLIERLLTNFHLYMEELVGVASDFRGFTTLRNLINAG